MAALVSDVCHDPEQSIGNAGPECQRDRVMHVDRARVQSRSLESMLMIGRETSREAPGVLISYNAIHIHSCS
nr:hypothetical protein CFP56_79598 [Quercus suber]